MLNYSESEHLSAPLDFEFEAKTYQNNQQPVPHLNTVAALQEIGQWHWLHEGND